MAVLKCKMCGGELDVHEGCTVIECDFCGTKQTVPSVTDENLNILFNRANTLRQKSEFDKSERIYEKILQVKDDESEAYWGLILCKYGIEYVEDPKTFNRVLTCHRTSYDSVIADEDYKNAIKYADSVQKGIYETEAKEIDRIQKEILELSQKEEPYDVFICYKETDEVGKRTQDSVIANDIYHQLTQEGFKVFYAAITLEDKLGTAYEPCIFAALNSAKVMLAVGTKPEYFNAVWVKNEWSRYMKLMKNDRSKIIIPCYRDMDAYELPEEFAHLQAQDMSKIGFINDVVRGINKLLRKKVNTPINESVKTVKASASEPGAPTASLLERAYMFLEDRDFSSAKEYFSKVLDIEPKCSDAYFGMLLAKFKVTSEQELIDKEKIIHKSKNLEKAIRFASDERKEILNGYLKNSENLIEKLAIRRKKAVGLLSGRYAVKTDGTVVSIISNTRAQSDVEYWRDIVKVACIYIEGDSNSTYGLKADGTVVYSGDPNDRDDNLIDWNNNFLTTYGRFHRASVNSDGTVSAEFTVTYTGDRNYNQGQCNVSNWKDIVAVAADFKTTVGLKSDGTVVATGNNDSGQCNVSDWRDIVAIDICNGCTIGLRSDGTVVATGNNDSDQCNVSDWENIITISILGKTTYGLKSDGAIISTDNNNPKIKLFEDIDNIDEERKIAIKAKKESDYLSALEFMSTGEDYSVAAEKFKLIGDYKDSKEKYEQCLNLLEEYSKDFVVKRRPNNPAINMISGGNCTIVGLRTDDRVLISPHGFSINTKLNFSDWSDLAAVAQGENTIVCLKTDGTVVAMGDNDDGQCNVSDWKDIIAIATANTNVGAHTVGLKADGTVVAVGGNVFGQCNVLDWKNIVAISVGFNNTVGLKSDGTVVTAGSCNFKIVSKWSKIVSIDTSACHLVGLKADSTVVAELFNEDENYGQCDVSDWKDIIAIAAGYNHTVGLKSDGTVIATGSNDDGQCNVNDWKNIVAVFANYWYTLGIKSDGTVVCTGAYYRNGVRHEFDLSDWKLFDNFDKLTDELQAKKERAEEERRIKEKKRKQQEEKRRQQIEATKQHNTKIQNQIDELSEKLRVQQRIYNENAGKIFGAGARAKKAAATEISSLTAEIQRLKSQLR